MDHGKINHEIAKFLEGYKHICDMSDNAIFIHDVKGDIFDVNKPAEKLTGYSHGELLGMNVRELHPIEEWNTATRQLQVISMHKKRVDFKSDFLRKDGKIVKVGIVADKFRFKNRNFVIGVVTDITYPERTNMPKREKFLKRISKRLRHPDKEYIESMRVLIDVAEARDPHTMKHSAKVTEYATALAAYLGLSKDNIIIIRLAAMFHDIGKVGIKRGILTKPSALNKDEFEEVKHHPLLSVEITKPLHFQKALIPIIRHHHENYDGTGYPDRLKGERIPLGARILAAVDVYDALTSKRAYRRAFSSKKAIEMMNKESGKKFDPVILKAFLNYLSAAKKKKK